MTSPLHRQRNDHLPPALIRPLSVGLHSEPHNLAVGVHLPPVHQDCVLGLAPGGGRTLSQYQCDSGRGLRLDVHLGRPELEHSRAGARELAFL